MPDLNSVFAAAGDADADGFDTGPAVGALLPDFELPDQQGRPWHFTHRRNGRPALVLFYRSASW